jgi:serine/threonine-protein kinase
VALAPDNHLGYSNLGAFSIEQGRYTDAISWFQRSVAIRPTYEAYSNLGTTYFYLHRFDESAATYEQAIGLDENNYELWGNLGDARYWASADHRGAPEAYRRAIALAEKKLNVNLRDAQVQRDLAVYHAMLLERLPALSSLQEALRLAPRDPDTLLKAALVDKQAGEDEQAVKWLQKAVNAGYPPALVRDNPVFASLTANQNFRALISGNQSAENGENRGGSK